MIYLKNNSARVVTVGSTPIPVQGVGAVDTDEKHKGVAMAVKKGWLEVTTEKEYRAYSDPAGVKAEAEAKAAAEAEANKKGK